MIKGMTAQIFHHAFYPKKILSYSFFIPEGTTFHHNNQ